MLRALAFYAASVVLLTLFGCEVCPYIESLGRATLAVLFGAFFAVAYVLRFPLERRWVQAAAPLLQPRRQFLLDLGSFLAVGVALTLYDRIVYGFPVGSGAKALLGTATMGLFFAADSALRRERELVPLIAARPESGEAPVRPFSLSAKFLVITLGALALMALDLGFLSLKDAQAASRAGGAVMGLEREVVSQTGIALMFFLPLAMNLVLGFARNLRLFLDNQQRALEEVSRGRLDVRVPVASTDEFAAIARHTNQMIAGLREREQIRGLFGKLVSPAIGQRLLASGELKLGGSRRRVVVLFSDVRDFTRRTEGASPEAVVADLNRYFGRMVELVHANGGVVDKFIGDGMMAIFGLETAGGAGDAVRAARAMIGALEPLNRELSLPIEIGIGIHLGEVVAGTLGAPDRLEFTVIGDTVNVAARLEGLTKELGAPIVISDEVRQALSGDPAGWPWSARGPRQVKGRTAKVVVHSLSPASAAAGSVDAGPDLSGAA